MIFQTSGNNNNMTTSTISLLASPEDSGKSIRCKADVPNLPNSGVETIQNLNIHCKYLTFKLLKLIIFFLDISSARLSLGSSLSVSDVKRGEDVYLECRVQASPRPHKVEWHKDVR